MDWDFSIERNRGMLLPHIAGLFALIGLVEGGMVERVSRPVYRKALTILKSAESAVRRLIIVMARDIKVEPRPKRPMPKGLLRSRKGTFQGKGKGQGGNGQSQESKTPQALLQLVRPGKALRCRPGFAAAGRKGRQVEPRIHSFDYDPRIPESIWPRAPRPTPAPAPQQVETVKDYTVSAKRLCRRLFAIMYALTHMEREAERYALWRDQPKEERRPQARKGLTLRLAAGLAHQANP